MTAAFHTFKLFPMAPTNIRQPAPTLPPSTPSNSNARPQPQQAVNNQQRDSQNSTPSTEPRMNPPHLPRSLMTPGRDVRDGRDGLDGRESSVVSSGGNSARKPRQNLDERDHVLMLKHCYEQRHNFKEGTKSQFWAGVNTAFQSETGKLLAQMSATVGRLVESRRRQIADWENGIIPQKPGGELNDALDQWMEFLKTEDGEAEAERMRQVEARRRVEEARKEARRAAIAAESLVNAQNPQIRTMSAPQQSPTDGDRQAQEGTMMQTNGQGETNDFRPHKRRRPNEHHVTQLQNQTQPEAWTYAPAHPPEPPKRVVVEGAMTKEDWREVIGNDARLRALENKVDKIEIIVSQNNKLLLQLLQNQNKDRNEEERVPVHLDAEFERDYL